MVNPVAPSISDNIWSGLPFLLYLEAKITLISHLCTYLALNYMVAVSGSINFDSQLCETLDVIW